MSAWEDLFRRVSGAFVDDERAKGLIDAYRAEVLREAAEDLRVSLARTTVGQSGDLTIVISRLADMADMADEADLGGAS